MLDTVQKTAKKRAAMLQGKTIHIFRRFPRKSYDNIRRNGNIGNFLSDFFRQSKILLFGIFPIIREAEALAADGVVEIMLLGQNVNSYGKNLDEPMSFAGLLKEIEKIEGIKRIRFMTSHPKDLSDELIEVMKHSKKICRHLHLPLQSGSTKILTAICSRT